VRAVTVGYRLVPEFPAECEPHTPQPNHDLRWARWHREIVKTHTPRQCKGCGLWVVWEPKTARES
jgi:hypothetical protein